MNVFISHVAADQPFVSSLSKTLKRGGLKVWDRSRLVPGSNIALEVGKALDEADAVVVVLSPEAIKSEWVRHEIEFAIGSSKFKGRLVPVLVRRTTEVPWILRELPQWIESDDPREAGRYIVSLLKTPAARAREAS
jgi:hypothetical protein